MKIYFMGGNYDACIKEGEKILARTNNHNYGFDELYYLLGISYLKQGNYLRAADIFEIILKEFKSSEFKEEAKLALADTYFLSGDYAKAESHYKELLNRSPSTKLKPSLYSRISQCALKQGNTSQAQEYLAKLKTDFPLSIEPVLEDNKSSPDIYYTVQVGSFLSQANAQRLTDKLIKQGYPAYLEQAVSQDKAVYRVRVGKFRLRKEAGDLEARLTQDGYATKIYP